MSIMENCTENMETGKRMKNSRLRNEKGIALVMIMILAAVGLVIMAGLLFLITSGTQVSGINKRYKTAFEAGIGGADLTYQLIALRGETTDTNTLISALSALHAAINTPGTCQGTNRSGTGFTGFSAKLNAPATSWTGCDSTLTIIPGTTSTYDFNFTVGTIPTYTVYAKVVNTVEGNSAGGEEELLKYGVVNSGSGEVAVMSAPYLYTLELDAENASDPSERAKLSILYQY